MNKTVEQFYKKNSDNGYKELYDSQHGSRIDYVIEKCKLNKVHDMKIGDFGCGLGNFFKRLDKSNKFVGIDGADIETKDMLCEFIFFKADLELPLMMGSISDEFDISICSEVIEHVANPYQLICNIKECTKRDGDIILTIPDVSVWHNTIYPALMFPHTNFEQFLGQMALPIKEYYFFQDGWKTHIWKCRNADWEESKMMFPKAEEKFKGATPLEYTNL
jgi:SAM-dependent methyltransferase